LETLLELAQTRTDDATKRLGALHAQGVRMETKLALLLQYRDEYRTRFQMLMRQGLTASDWRNYQEFLDKLDAAVTQQQDALISAQRRLAAGKLAWQSAKRTFNSYDTLAQRQVQAELLRSAKRDQLEADELANNATARKDTLS
jgi:flagellar FliJ protein